MHAYPWAKALIAAALACALTACGQSGDDATPQSSVQPSYPRPVQTGWSNNCTLRCTNVSVNQPETMERPGRMGPHTSCRASKQSCEAELAVACANAVAAANNETLYDNCEVIGTGECMEGCAVYPK